MLINVSEGMCCMDILPIKEKKLHRFTPPHVCLVLHIRRRAEREKGGSLQYSPTSVPLTNECPTLCRRRIVTNWLSNQIIQNGVFISDRKSQKEISQSIQINSKHTNTGMNKYFFTFPTSNRAYLHFLFSTRTS